MHCSPEKLRCGESDAKEGCTGRLIKASGMPVCCDRRPSDSGATAKGSQYPQANDACCSHVPSPGLVALFAHSFLSAHG